ncbi:MAG: peptide ABC transporter substrate-binding protein [Bacteroidetes bacterium]|nr:peptide ABC transporter substrate-binding protein [Bacteroidota bacterium]MCL5025988.1 peptide ABC transporter substrate-binding protein [Chloroflexota bacterium]
MRQPARRVVPLSVAVLLLALLALWLGIPLAAPKTTGTESGPASPAGPAGPTLAPAPLQLIPIQELRLNLTGEPETIDPSRVSWDNQIVVVLQAFEGLLGYNQDLTLRPLVARDLPSVANGGVSPDLRTYTLHLRHDKRWSDGRPVTARDFEYSLKRLLSPKLNAEYAPLYYAIEGAREYNTAAPGSPRLKEMEANVGVHALDDYTLQLKLVEPWAAFPQLLALWPAVPLRQDVIGQYGESWTQPGHYLGNGPFRLIEWTSHDHLTLAADEGYVGIKPKLQKITMAMEPDPQADLAAYLRGARDIVAVSTADIARAMADPATSQELMRYPDLAVSGLRLNPARPPFDNPKVRQAVATAIDREAFVRQIGNGVGKPAYSWIPPGMPGHDPTLGYHFHLNPAAARQALAETATPNGLGNGREMPPLVFSYANNSQGAGMADFVKDQMSRHLGLSVEPGPLLPRAFQQAVARGDYQMVWFAWGTNYPDPDPRSWIRGLFAAEADNGAASFGNPALDDMARRARVEPDEHRRLLMWAEAHRMITDDATFVFLSYRENLALVKPRVKGLKPTAMDGRFPGRYFYNEVYVGE